MKIGIVPYYADLLDDELFEYDGYDLGKHYGIDRLGFKKLREKLEQMGNEIHTFDYYDSYADMDVCLVIDTRWSILKELMETTNGPKIVYVMRESPAYIQFNCQANVQLFSQFFDAVLTWDDVLADRYDHFYEYKLPYLQPGISRSAVNYGDRNLLVCVAGDKYSTYPNELYSARRAIIEYYGEHFPDLFSLYGRGWDRHSIRKRIQPFTRSNIDNVYKGSIEKKQTVYDRHKFAVCFENVTNVRGYVTEKLFDCFRAGIVPIYWGAENITDYVPSKCFIDYRDLSGPEELHSYINSMSKSEHKQYLKAAEEFLSEGASQFRPETYADQMHKNLEEINEFGKKSENKIPTWLRDDFESRVLADKLKNSSSPVDKITYVQNLVGIAQRNPKMLINDISIILGLLKSQH